MRLLQRGKESNKVEETILKPAYTIRRGEKIEAFKQFDNELLKVVYVETERFIKIITIYWMN